MPAKDDQEVVFVDHSGLPGGGQLGLVRYLSSAASKRASVVVLGDGDTFDELPSSRVYKLQAQSRWDELLKARRLISRALVASGARILVANSLRAAAVLALSPRLPGIAYIYYLRVDLSRSKMSMARWLFITRFMLPRFDGFISNSEWTASTIPGRFRRKPSAVAYPVSGTRRLESFTAAEAADSEPLTVLSLSRVVAWKGIHILVDAMKILVDTGYGGRVRAIIAGSDFHEESGYASTLESRVTADLSVSFVGHQTDVAALLSEADVVVSCSLVPEPFGQVIAQGLAAGKPVISSDGGGPREMIQSGVNGLLVEADDAEALAAALRELIDNRHLRRKLAQNAMNSAAKFSDTATTASLARAIVDVAAAIAREDQS
jgi:glycosyltransferase involved in cell wall biosynthesis